MPPRYATPRNPSRPTDAIYGQAIAAAMGRPWMPYQLAAAEVAGELLPDGGYAYPVVIVTWPRQAAKTTTAYDLALGRGRAYRDYRCRYSTHKGTLTSDRFVDWFLELERARLDRYLKLRHSRGTEAIVWRRRGSYFQAFPARDGALRSAALDMVVVDEAQEHDDVLGEALKRTITPTFSTRRRRQLWVIFTAGTDASTYAAGYLRKGRAGLPGYCLIDYGCPDGVDPLDRDLWHTWHPGLAHGLTDLQALDLALAEGEASFIREYGNIWTRTAAGRVIPEDDWAAVQFDELERPGRACLGVDASPDRSTAVIACTWDDDESEILEGDLDLGAAAGAVIDYARALDASVAIDSIGPVGTIRDALERDGRLGDRLLVTRTQDVANAAADLLDAVKARTCRILRDPILDAAVEAADIRALGDGGFAWSRKTSAAPIAALVALCAARWGHARLPAPLRKPVAVA